ncbi:BZ3500_MvSof-1268-A1-R1_Chr5-3g08168 [Microbotryum saponariae]|uniref:BZ3500_MvSof-1268-A1-R1_Chr5-3g08168 protein n=1 Tax=Microbotryum saponariae TaxID=289078 RepID=A0A2X0NQ07_9BASI|nr:BZ3500_MvSof-1268-A1-R1_Chr5-3g08168 [Microbotryum saponariae]SDA07927.1 BZ3501_MvSof-1269-A2-R1_Chr5-1g07312 [Microbotryum saponariae]
MSSTSATTQRKIAPSTTPSSAIAAANAAKAAKETMRSARACVACRKLKTKCITSDNPDLPCKRCTANNLECVFEDIMPSVSTINPRPIAYGGSPARGRNTPSCRNKTDLFPCVRSFSNSARVEQLEREFQVVQSELQRLRQLESEVGAIKLLIPRAFGIPGAGDQKSLATSGMIPSPPALPGYFAGGNKNGSVAGSSTSHAASNPSPVGLSQSLGASVRSFGGETGIRSSLPLRRPADDPVASTNVSDDEGDRDDGEDEDHLPRSVFVAPVETLNRLAEEQAQAQRRAADGSWIKPPNRKKPRRAYEPATPPDRIPDIIDKGVLDEIMARDLHAVSVFSLSQ